jgi:hypothetical protein
VLKDRSHKVHDGAVSPYRGDEWEEDGDDGDGDGDGEQGHRSDSASASASAASIYTGSPVTGVGLFLPRSSLSADLIGVLMQLLTDGFQNSDDPGVLSRGRLRELVSGSAVSDRIGDSAEGGIEFCT